MPIKEWCFFCALALVAQVFSLGSLPFALVQPWDGAFHVLAFSALTLLLWIATDGRRPTLVVAGVMALALVDELRQAFIPARGADFFEFLAAASAAGITGFLLLWLKGPVCAESSQP